MHNFIFNPKSVFSFQKQDIEEQSSFFTLTGDEDFIDNEGHARTNKDNEKVFAKKISRKDGTIKYTIKLSGNGKFYNPISIYDSENNTSTFLSRVCRSDQKFKEVNEKTFRWYIKFLNTKNISWLYNAEREME